MSVPQPTTDNDTMLHVAYSIAGCLEPGTRSDELFLC